MRLQTFFAAAITAPLATMAAPTMNVALDTRGENLCNQYKSPPQLCTPSDNVTVEETAQRAYKFYKAFVVDGDARTMFSLIDNQYIVCCSFLTLFLPFSLTLLFPFTIQL